MLGGVRLKVVYTHEKSCFAYISPKYTTNTDQNQCIQVLYKDKRLFLWTVFSHSAHEGQLAINPVYSRLIGLEEDNDVFVSPYSDVKVLDELYIDTDSPDDQEILEHNAELLQLRILDQLRLVAANQKAVVWIYASMPIVFTPKQTGLLVDKSQIIVKVDAFNTLRSYPSPVEKVTDNKSEYKNIGVINDGMLQPYFNIQKRIVLRGLPIDSDGKKNLIHPYTVFIHEDLIEEKYRSFTLLLGTIESIRSVIQEKDEEENQVTQSEIKDLCVEIVLVNNIVFKSLCHEAYHKSIPTVLIPKSLNSIINIENGMKLILSIIEETVEQPEHIHLVTYSDDNRTELDTLDRFKNCVVNNTHFGKQFVINHGMVKQNAEITNGYLKFKLKPERIKYTVLNSESFRHCTLSAKCMSETDLTLPKPSISKIEYDYKDYCRSIKSHQILVEKILSHLYFEIHREASFKGVSEIKSNVLITGASGTGKSTICRMVQKDLTVWSHILHCRSLKGRKDIPEVLGKALLMCQEHSPAVLICDDIDSLVAPEVEGTSPADVAYNQRLAAAVSRTLQSRAGVCTLLSCAGAAALHPALRRARAPTFYTAQFDIPELQQSERAELLKHLINAKIREQFSVEDDDVINMASDTAGCSARDVVDYLNKKIFQAVKKKHSNPDAPKPRLIEGIALESQRSRDFDVWGPLGGLHDVKDQLDELIFWPLQYPALFPSQSCGILLYGPPGSGKSYIGSLLARARGINLITVKGPELLSKYIGQSEKAVRDIFDKADMLRPSILFFDEFDSLAPKRGHDSTGVTDRVVNQLLSRLDGAEGRARGVVLAATSRPDRVDPALLRPGRLASWVYCRLPTLSERLEVLQRVANDVTLDSGVDLSLLASRTEGFSPADLRALLVTAQLTRLEKLLEISEEKNMDTVVVYKEDIESALRETKPSLSTEQRLFYDVIYKKFRGENLTPEQRLMTSELQNQKVTLA